MSPIVPSAMWPEYHGGIPRKRVARRHQRDRVYHSSAKLGSHQRMRYQRGIACDDCDKWHHAKCIDMPTAEYTQLSNSTDDWHCRRCVLLQFTASLFDSPSSSSTLGSEQSEHTFNYDLFQELDSVRISCPKNIMISHININSVRNKFHELSDLFNRYLVDILFISETTLTKKSA